jgi:ankyrin repeat protein
MFLTANIEQRTKGEEQTPVHFAARNDACQSLKALVKGGAKYKDVRDYKGRTPLHLAAELGQYTSILRVF